MPCYHPLKGWWGKKPDTDGIVVVFKKENSFGNTPQSLQVPCGRCIGCRLEKSRQWAIRCTHESTLYKDNCFITLTYSDEKNPVSLNTKDFQLFMKRLRKYYSPQKIRFFMGAEYGEQTGRPHHHAILFNCDFPDKKLVRNNSKGQLYTSATLDSLWSNGSTTIGNVTMESAQYVAKYAVKKIYGDMAKSHYQGKKPEYSTMSRKPGIGTNWLKKYSTDVYPNDYVVIKNGSKIKPPKFYDNILAKEQEQVYAKIKSIRKSNAKISPDNTFERLFTRETVKKATLSQKQNPGL